MKDKVELDAVYPVSPSVVWQALTDPAAMRDWLMPSDFQPLIGFRFRFERADGRPVTGRVIEVDKEKLLAYTWDDGESPEPSVVCWQLDPTEDGTRVRLEHRYVETPVVNCIPMPWYFNWRYAMRHSLPGLLALLAGGQARPPVFYGISSEFHAETQRSAEAQSGDRRIGLRQEVVMQ